MTTPTGNYYEANSELALQLDGLANQFWIVYQEVREQETDLAIIEQRTRWLRAFWGRHAYQTVQRHAGQRIIDSGLGARLWHRTLERTCPIPRNPLRQSQPFGRALEGGAA